MTEGTGAAWTVDQLVATLTAYGAHQDVDSLTEARPYLDALARTFAGREPRSVTPKELHRFHRTATADPAIGELEVLLTRKSARWESAYLLRSQGVVSCLQWESTRPVRALVELFERPGFRPRRVLELGCGTGVNAVFMAQQGCAVTAIDIAPTALRMAHDNVRRAGVDVELVEGDLFELGERAGQVDFVFDRGTFHHVPVFRFEDYAGLVAERLAPGGWFHLICHHVSTRPTVVLDAMAGFVGKLLGFITGALIETGAGFTADEIVQVFGDRFRLESNQLVGDDNNRPLRFNSAVLQRLG